MFEVGLRTLRISRITRFARVGRRHIAFAAKRLFLFSLIFAWVFSGMLQIYNFPPKPEEASAGSGDVILLWDTANGPSPVNYDGWTCISCASNDAFYNKFLMASTTYDGKDYGQDLAAHDMTATASTTGAGRGSSAAAGSVFAHAAHSHSWGATTTTYVDIKPLYKNLMVIKKNNPTNIPAGAIAMFDVASSSLPSGWSDYGNLGGRYLRGANDNTAAGATTHTHATQAIITSGASVKPVADAGNGLSGTPTNHTHTIDVASLSTSSNNDPLFATIVFGKLNATSTPTTDMIAMFDADPPSGWTLFSSLTSAIAGRFIKGNAVYGTQGGSLTHEHGGSEIFTSTGPTGTDNAKAGTPTTFELAGNAHTHTATYSIAASTTLPLHRSIILAKKDPSSLVVSGNVYTDENTTVDTANICNGSNNVAVAVGTSTPGVFTGSCNGSGIYSITLTNTTSLAAETPIIAYINGVGSMFGSSATRYLGSGDVSSLIVRQNRVIVSHDNSSPITNGNLDTWDNGNDTDVNYVVTNGVLTVEAGSKLIVNAGKTFQPGEAVTVTGGGASPDGDLQINSGATMTATSTVTVGNMLLNFGTYNGYGTTTFTGTSGSFNLGTNNIIKNLELSGSASITASSSFTATGTVLVGSGNTLTINSGVVATTTGVFSLAGTINGSGTTTIATTTSINIDSGATFSSNLRLDVSFPGFGASRTFPSRTYGGNLELYQNGAGSVTNDALPTSGTLTINGNLYFNSRNTKPLRMANGGVAVTVSVLGDLNFVSGCSCTQTLEGPSGGTMTISGNANLTNGTYNGVVGAGSTLIMNGTSKTLTSASQTLNNVTLSGTITLADSVSAGGNATISGTVTTGSNALSLTGANKTLTGGGSIEDLTISSNASSTLSGADLTVSDTLTLTGAIEVGSGRYLTSDTTGTLTLAGTLHGAGTTTIQNSNFSTSTGAIINGNLRFDPTSGNINMPALTTGGNIEIYNSGAPNRIVAMQTGGGAATTTIAKALMLNAAGSGNVALSATSSNAALITATTTYLNGGAGKEEMFAGTRNWDFDADLDVSAGNFLFSSATTTIAGNYTASAASTTANSGTVIFDGANQQTITGNATSSNGFYNLAITNTSGSNPVDSPSVIFTDAASTTNLFSLTTPGAKVRLGAGKLYTFQNTSWTNPGATLATLYSSSAGTQSTLYIPGTQQTVSYIGFKDMTCGNGTTIEALTANGNSDATGNGECISFSTFTLSITSAANQVFEYGQSPAAISAITVTSGIGASAVSSGNELRIGIATSSVDSAVNMTWNTSDTAATLAGSGQSKACSNQTNCTDITYDPTGSVMIVPIDTNFSGGQTLIISDLAFANFNAAVASSSALRIFLDGTTDINANATNTAQYVAIKGKQTLSNHAAGHETNKFAVGADTSVSNVDLISFKLTPVAEGVTISQLVFSLSGVSGFITENITGALLYPDYNANGEVDAGETSVMGAGAVSISADTGTITFSTSFSTSTARSYILQASVASINGGDELFIDLTGGNITMTGATSLQTISATGNITKIKHHKPQGTQGELDFPPAGRAVTTGGGGGGGATLGDDPNYSAPTALGSTFSQWTNATNAFSSNDSSASETTANDKQDYRDFSFNVPAGNTINGIEVKLEASGSTAAGTIGVELSWNSGTSVTSSGKVTNTLSTVDDVYSLGGATDTWGRSWSASDFSNANFRVRVNANPSSNTINLDAMQVRVHHQASGGGGGGGGDVRAPFHQYYASILESLEKLSQLLSLLL